MEKKSVEYGEICIRSAEEVVETAGSAQLVMRALTAGQFIVISGF